MRRLAAILTVTTWMGWLGGLGCVAGPEVETVEQGVTSCATGPTLEGIDVSHWQGAIDWDQVAAAGIRFAFVRVSDGTSTLDTRFQTNWTEARRVGIVRAAYQFFRPSQDAVAQADLVIQRIGGAMTPGDLPPVIDVEVNSGLSKTTVAARVQAWLDRVESVLGVRPLVYTSPGLWSSYVNSTAFGTYPLWLAHYYVTCPTLPTGWSQWQFHQYTDSGTVAGIATNVDRNRFNGDLSALQSLTWGDPVCGDGVCNAGESTTCPGDCPTCQDVPAAGRVLDEEDLCLELGGDPQYWRSESAGFGGRLRWTYTTSTQAYNFAEWSLTFADGGWYRLEAYTAAPWAESRQAKYSVTHGGVTDVVPMDQTAVNGWSEVGVFEFVAGGGQRVRLEDMTGEPGSTTTRLVVDALRLVPVAAPDGCETIPAAGRIIEETDACVDLEGDAQYWRTEAAGSGGSLRWTHTVATQAYNYAVWNLSFQQAGHYLVEAYTAAPWAESRKARYQVRHDHAAITVTVDQTARDGWARVGEFDFAAGGGQWVLLDDLTGEPGSTTTRLVVDAIRVTAIEPGYGGALVPEEDREANAGNAPPEEPADPASGDAPAMPQGRVHTVAACQASDAGQDTVPGEAWWLLLPLGLVWLRRRRLRRQTSYSGSIPKTTVS